MSKTIQKPAWIGLVNEKSSIAFFINSMVANYSTDQIINRGIAKGHFTSTEQGAHFVNEFITWINIK